MRFLLDYFTKCFRRWLPIEKKTVLFCFVLLLLGTSLYSEIGLTPAEKAWLAAHPAIRVVQDPLWPPIEFIDGKGDTQGISEDYLKRIEELLGVKFIRVRGLSWQEAYAKLKRREIDMTTSVTVTPERREFWAFTEPYLVIPIVILTRTDVTYVNGMKDLQGKRVAVVDGYAVSEWIPREYPRLELVKVESAIEGLRLLVSGEVFAFIDNMLVASYYLAKLKLTNVKIAGHTPYENAQAMAVRKDWDVFAGILQKVLSSISEEEKSAIYYKWVPIRYEHGFDYSLFWRIFAVVGAVVLVLLLWVLRLRREIRRRKKVEAALAESEGRMRLHVKETPVAVIGWDEGFRVASWNPAAERIFGFSQEEALGRPAEFLFPEDARPAIAAVLERLEARPGSVHEQIKNLTRGGKALVCDWISTSLADASGKVTWAVSLVRDITTEKAYEESLRSAVADREILLRELYHRTKNSMNVISSFLQIQASRFPNPAFDGIVKKTVSRIQAMALAHQELYESKNLSRINLGRYAKKIVDMARSQYGRRDLKIEEGSEADEVEVLLDVAVPCGLILNELAMNSFQHAFPAGRSGSVAVGVRWVKAMVIEIAFSDDGVGVGPDIDLRTAETLGLQTVFNVAERQLGASVAWDSTRGLAYKMRFDLARFYDRLPR